MNEVGNNADIYEAHGDPDANWDIHPGVNGYEYPIEGCNWRIGVVKDVVIDTKQLDAVRTILTASFTGDLTRNMARVVITEDILRNHKEELEDLLPDMEIIIPLKESGIKELEDYYQVTFSRNDPSRQTSPDQIKKELEEASQAFRNGKEKEGTLTSLPSIPGVTISQLDENSGKSIKDSFTELVSSSTNESEDALEGLDNGKRVNLAATVMIEGIPTTVSAVYADEDTDVVFRNGKPIEVKTYEIGGAKTKTDYGNRGLYTNLMVRMYKLLAQKKNVAFIFGYSNAENAPVMAVAGKTGRSIVTDVASELGLPIRPAMKQTVTDGKLVDEIVTFIPGNRLRKYYGDNSPLM